MCEPLDKIPVDLPRGWRPSRLATGYLTHNPFPTVDRKRPSSPVKFAERKQAERPSVADGNTTTIFKPDVRDKRRVRELQHKSGAEACTPKNQPMVCGRWSSAQPRAPIVIEIDGSHGEGGGQIVRTACSLAALTGKPCRIFNIRERRRKPGLMLQHLLAIRALAELCDASLAGDSIGSRELAFEPRRFASRELITRITTAGSITLILQAVIPASLVAPNPITIRFEGGATDTAMSPTLDYFRNVFLWFLRRMGVRVEINVSRRGYYPRGGAELGVEIAPARLAPLDLIERGPLRAVRVFSHAAGVLKARRVAERQARAALEVLGPLGVAPQVNLDYASSLAAGSATCVVAEFANTVIGADALGAAGKPAEQVGREAAVGLMGEVAAPACLDRHMADQILPYMALAGENGRVTVSEVTEHCRTNMWVIEKFLIGYFEVTRNLIGWIHRPSGETLRPQ